MHAAAIYRKDYVSDIARLVRLVHCRLDSDLRRDCLPSKDQFCLVGTRRWNHWVGLQTSRRDEAASPF